MTPGRGSALRSLAWDHGVVSVQALGGMIGPTAFVLPDGRQASPFHIPPWHADPQMRDEGGMLGGLRGEWPCVPFGYPFPSDERSADWPAGIEERAAVAHAHGYSSNVAWTFGDPAPDHIALSVETPEDQAVRRLRRIVRPDPGAAALDIELTVEMRRPAREPMAIHGCFALPPVAGAARLVPGPFREGRTFPGTVEPSAPIFAVDATFADLAEVPGRKGAPVDATRLPFAADGEDLLQLNDVTGPMALIDSGRGIRTTLDWDRSVLPSVLLWFSNRGRPMAPWNNRHLCLGIEPVCSAFGMSPDMSRADNPITRAGTPTAVALSPDAPLTLRYRVAVTPEETQP
ncbi:hypothetical protein DXV76_15980 [Rhodobacteraceae bacterium CCMM004]|nr:hypothetical protein DXV76_15980 [Rhodobacteraceae bacterium CCMM004]